MDRRFDVVLIDGTNVAHRAWHASGKNPSEASGMLTAMVRNAVLAHRPTFAAFATDAPTCFRRELYPDYKAHRRLNPDADTEARDEWIEILRDLDNIGGVRVVGAEDHEADDVVATLHAQARRLVSFETLILTSDLDSYALVDEHTTVGKPALYSRGPYFSPKDVWDKFRVWPSQIAAYKAMAGDHSDNVHGVPGVGPVWAARFCAMAKEGPMSAFNEITSPPASCPVEEARQRALICHAVTLLRRDAPCDHDLLDCEVRACRTSSTS